MTYPAPGLYPGTGTFPSDGTTPPGVTVVNVPAATVTWSAHAPTIVNTPGLTVTPEPGNEPPRMRIDIIGLAGSVVDIYRTDPNGVNIPIRFGFPAALTAGDVTVYDYEAAWNTPVAYRAHPTTGADVSNSGTLTVTRPWLIHLAAPALSQPLTVRLLDTDTLTPNAAVVPVIGRAAGIPLSDGARKKPSFQMLAKTPTLDRNLRLESLLSDTTVLLLQCAYTYAADPEYRYVSVGEVSRTRFTGDYSDPRRTWQVACTQVDRPAASIALQRTYDMLPGEAATYPLLAARYATYRGVASGVPGQ